MKIGIDIDDVLAAFSTQWQNYYNKTYGTNYKFEDIIDYNFGVVYKDASPEEVVKRAFEFVNSPDFLLINTVEGSTEGISSLKNHELFVITSRSDDIKQTSIDWLDKHFPNKFKDIIFTNSFSNNPNLKVVTKAEVGKRLGITTMVEDAPSHAINFAENGVKSILLDKPWNRSMKGHDLITRAKTWEEVTKLING
ncbi:MAG: 5' nucleotidase, NT5C type [Candidatus Dojkabacteria bacterium]